MLRRQQNTLRYSALRHRGERPDPHQAGSTVAPIRRDPPRARIAGPRGSPTPPATGRGACRRRRTSCPPRSGSRTVFAAHVAARIQRHARPAPAAPAARGPRKPIASSTRSAFSWNSLPGDFAHLSCGRRRPSPTRRARIPAPSILPFSPTARLVSTAQSRSHAFLMRVRGAQLERPVRPDQRLVLLLRRLRQDLELGDRGRALADRGADAVRAGIAAADHHDMLALGGDRAVAARRVASSSPAPRLFCWVRKSMAKWMPSSSRPGTSRSRGHSAPPASTTAS